MNETAKVAKKALKSTAIVEQLETLQLAISKLENLADRITGENSMESEKSRTYDNMSLSSLLTVTPEVLDGFSSTVYKTVDKITEVLY